MLREYEFTMIARGDLPEAEISKLQTKYEKYMTSDGGQILKKEHWGSRRMAFAMKKHFRGNYCNYDFIGTSQNLAEMERLMRIDDDVLRYLSVFVGENVDVVQRKDQLAKVAVAARESSSAAYEDRDSGQGRDRDRD